MNLLIIQARIGSTRLTGKVLKEIHGKTLLQHLVDRVSPARTVDKIVVATTVNPEDDAIEAFCRQRNIACHRGSDWDVLSRFYEAALPYNPANVIRVTSDCPLHHHDVIDFVVNEYLASGSDYFSNSNNEPEVIEDGFDTEVFSFTTLATAHRQAKMLSEREHVTPYIKNSGKFTCAWKAYNKEYKYKLSVDSPADFVTVETIFRELSGVNDFGMADVIKLLKARPEITLLNSDSVPNTGYQKSVKNDKPVN